MKLPLTLVALFLTVGAFSQQSAKPIPSVLLHGQQVVGQPTGAIHGVVIGHGGQPAKRIRVVAFWDCPGPCQIVMSTAMTNEAGEYRFEPVTLGRYSLCAGASSMLTPSPFSGCSMFTTSPLSANPVELSLDHPEAEVRFEVRERLP